MKSSIKATFRRAFSLTELLIAIAVLGILLALVIPSFSGILDKAQDQKALRNAQNLVSPFNNARNCGAVFATYTKESVADALTGNTPGVVVQGSGMFATTPFRLSMSAAEVANALVYIEAQGSGLAFVLQVTQS